MCFDTLTKGDRLADLWSATSERTSGGCADGPTRGRPARSRRAADHRWTAPGTIRAGRRRAPSTLRELAARLGGRDDHLLAATASRVRSGRPGARRRHDRTGPTSPRLRGTTRCPAADRRPAARAAYAAIEPGVTPGGRRRRRPGRAGPGHLTAAADRPGGRGGSTGLDDPCGWRRATGSPSSRCTPGGYQPDRRLRPPPVRRHRRLAVRRPDAGVTAARYDVVVVGGGHNGLIAAAYLARAGWSVLVLERRRVLGGAASASRSSPASTSGCPRTPTWSACCRTGSSPTSRCDVRLLDRPVASYTPAAARRPARRAAGRARRGAGDRDVLPAADRLGRRVRRLAAVLRPAGHAGRGPRAHADRAAAWPRDELAARLRDPQLWHDLRERPLADVVADHLADDDVRGVALTDGLIGTFADVHAADGLAGRCFLYHLIGNGTGRWRVPVGGMGAVSGALAAAAAGRRRGAGHPGHGHRAGDPRRTASTVHWTDDDGADAGRRRRATWCAAPHPPCSPS